MAQMKVKYLQRRKVVSVKEWLDRQHVSGSGADAIFRTVSKGWFVYLLGGDNFYVGHEKPLFKAGDHVNLILEGTVEDAHASTPTGHDDNKDAPTGGQRNG